MIPMQHSLTQGPITKNILLFALPLMFGNLLQQMYNIALPTPGWWAASSARMRWRRWVPPTP